MLVLGGPSQGGAYDPASDQWWPMSMQDAPSFSDGVAVWTGKAMLVWESPPRRPTTWSAAAPATRPRAGWGSRSGRP